MAARHGASPDRDTASVEEAYAGHRREPAAAGAAALGDRRPAVGPGLGRLELGRERQQRALAGGLADELDAEGQAGAASSAGRS